MGKCNSCGIEVGNWKYCDDCRSNSSKAKADYSEVLGSSTTSRTKVRWWRWLFFIIPGVLTLIGGLIPVGIILLLIGIWPIFRSN